MRLLIVGLGNMGQSHALAYHQMPEIEIVGLCSRSALSMPDLPDILADYPRYEDYQTALTDLKPDAVCICTWPDTHAQFAKMAFAAGAHVFLEKPIAETVAESIEVIEAAREAGKKLVVGYILRHHPAWAAFVAEARQLGKPLVMRMNLNQQSSGATWQVHQHLMQSLSPIVDCGVHYVDVMCQMTQSMPISVHAIGARLSDDLKPGMYNYGQLQVRFADGSIGWYEAGWGPMISETAFFVKDVFGPKGAVSIVAESIEDQQQSDDIDAHTRTNALRVHKADLTDQGRFAHPDKILSMADEPDHLGLCLAEQDYFYRAVTEDLDLEDHWQDAVNSLRIVLAADQSIREQKLIALG